MIKVAEEKKKAPLPHNISVWFSESQLKCRWEDAVLPHSQSVSLTNGTTFKSLCDRRATCDIKNESLAVYT